MGNGTIFMIDEQNQPVELREEAYKQEKDLQELIAEIPQLLAGDEMGAGTPRRWLLVTREMPVRVEDQAYGYLDLLFLDQDSVPTLVEVKRSSDTRIRREVVGQMMDYAANAARDWPVKRMREYFDRRFRDEPEGADRALSNFLGDTDPEAFWERAKTNLEAGRVRLVFVADVIPASLKAIIEFLNGQMDPAEVLGVEVRQYASGTLRTLVPRVIGQTATAERKKGRSQAEQWTLPRFRERLKERKGAAAVEVADRILEWARERMPDFWYGRGTMDGSIIPRLYVNGRRYLFFTLYSYGSIELAPQWMKPMPGFETDERRREFLERINAIPGVSVPVDAIARRPSSQMLLLQSDEARRAFFDVMEWAISVSREGAARWNASENPEEAARALEESISRMSAT
ncbi:MAG TPA: hypothetical protein VGC13_09385 [Longimicrobium sp.]|jgi:hypothetical protein|uniref:hypothetical protein n=1 Tax=Longimicrobium sp. TaxID=2029185 RepID=UPI002EDAECB7